MSFWGTSRWPQSQTISRKHCDTNRRRISIQNGRRTAIQKGQALKVFPFPQSSGAPKVLQYKLEAYSNTNCRCIAALFWEVLVVGVSDMLLENYQFKSSVENMALMLGRSAASKFLFYVRPVSGPENTSNKGKTPCLTLKPCEFFRKGLMSVTFFDHNSRTENGCPNFMGAWVFGFFQQEKNLHAHNILRF